jgi:hypothetical protein
MVMFVVKNKSHGKEREREVEKERRIDAVRVEVTFCSLNYSLGNTLVERTDFFSVVFQPLKLIFFLFLSFCSRLSQIAQRWTKNERITEQRKTDRMCPLD